jgi:hypothetical protein
MEEGRARAEGREILPLAPSSSAAAWNLGGTGGSHAESRGVSGGAGQAGRG